MLLMVTIVYFLNQACVSASMPCSRVRRRSCLDVVSIDFLQTDRYLYSSEAPAFVTKKGESVAAVLHRGALAAPMACATERCRPAMPCSLLKLRQSSTKYQDRCSPSRSPSW